MSAEEAVGLDPDQIPQLEPVVAPNPLLAGIDLSAIEEAAAVYQPAAVRARSILGDDEALVPVVPQVDPTVVDRVAADTRVYKPGSRSAPPPVEEPAPSARDDFAVFGEHDAPPLIPIASVVDNKPPMRRTANRAAAQPAGPVVEVRDFGETGLAIETARTKHDKKAERERRRREEQERREQERREREERAREQREAEERRRREIEMAKEEARRAREEAAERRRREEQERRDAEERQRVLRENAEANRRLAQRQHQERMREEAKAAKAQTAAQRRAVHQEQRAAKREARLAAKAARVAQRQARKESKSTAKSAERQFRPPLPPLTSPPVDAMPAAGASTSAPAGPAGQVAWAPVNATPAPIPVQRETASSLPREVKTQVRAHARRDRAMVRRRAKADRVRVRSAVRLARKAGTAQRLDARIRASKESA